MSFTFFPFAPPDVSKFRSTRPWKFRSNDLRTSLQGELIESVSILAPMLPHTKREFRFVKHLSYRLATNPLAYGLVDER